MLPWPPTANLIWRRTGTRIHVSGEYRRWKEHAAKALLLQRPRAIVGEAKLIIDLCPPPKTNNWDLDNRVKPVLDALVASGILTDDNSRTVTEILVRVRGREPGANVTLEGVTA